MDEHTQDTTNETQNETNTETSVEASEPVAEEKKKCLLAALHSPGYGPVPSETVLIGFFTNKEAAQRIADWGRKEYYLKGKDRVDIVIEEIDEDDIPEIIAARTDEDNHKRSLSYPLQYAEAKVYSYFADYLAEHITAMIALTSKKRTT